MTQLLQLIRGKMIFYKLNGFKVIFRRTLFRILIFILLLILPAGCARHIIPRPEFNWPEMESSKIDGILGIYISTDNVNRVILSDPEKNYFSHKDIFIGQGILQAIKLSSQAVFSKTIYLGEEPSDIYIRSLNLRGLLHLKDIVANVDILPYGDEVNKKGESKLYKVSVMISLNFSAIDFLLSDIRDFNVDVQTESGKAIPQNKINSYLNNMSKSALEKAASQLARKLVNVYGARD